MPNYSLLINSEFKPYSFDELVKPFQMYAQAYNDVDSAYNTLGTNAGALESVLNQERDKAAWGQYNAYMQGLNDAATELATKGLSPAARTQVGNLTKQYAQNIVPIQKAAETWQKQIEEQRKTGYNMINSYDASKLSIDQFLENPQLTYQTIDRYKLADQSAKLYSNMAKDLREATITKTDSKGNKIPYYIWYKEKYGVTPDEAQEFMAVMQTAIDSGNKDLLPYAMSVNPKLGNVFNTIFQSTPAVNWTDQEAKADVMGTILQGVMSAVGTEHYKPMEDKAAVLAAQRRNQTQPTVTNHTSPNIVPLRDELQIGKQQSEHDRWVSKGYLTKDGHLTPAGRDALYSKKVNSNISLGTSNSASLPTKDGRIRTTGGAAIFSNVGGISRAGYQGSHVEKKRYTSELTAFGKYMNKITGSSFLKNFDKQEGTFEYDINESNMGKYRDYLESIKPENYDVYRTYEVQYNIPDSDQKEFATALINQLPVDKKGKQYLEEVNYDASKKQFVPTGKKIEVKPEDIDKYKVSQQRGSNAGQTAMMQTPEGSRVRVLIPTNMNPSLLSPPTKSGGNYFIGNIPASFNRIDVYNEILDTNKMPMTDDKGRIVTDEKGNIVYTNKDLTDEQRYIFEERLATEWDANSQLFGEIYVTNKTESRKIKPDTRYPYNTQINTDNE